MIELAADAPLSGDLAAGGVFVPGCTLRMADECDLVVCGANGQVSLPARVVYVDGHRGAGLELIGFSTAMRAQLAELAPIARRAELAASDDDLAVPVANEGDDGDDHHLTVPVSTGVRDAVDLDDAGDLGAGSPAGAGDELAGETAAADDLEPALDDDAARPVFLDDDLDDDLADDLAVPVAVEIDDDPRTMPVSTGVRDAADLELPALCAALTEDDLALAMDAELERAIAGFVRRPATGELWGSDPALEIVETDRATDTGASFFDIVGPVAGSDPRSAEAAGADGHTEHADPELGVPAHTRRHPGPGRSGSGLADAGYWDSAEIADPGLETGEHTAGGFSAAQGTRRRTAVQGPDTASFAAERTESELSANEVTDPGLDIAEYTAGGFSAAEGTRRSSAGRETTSFAAEVTEPEGSPAEHTAAGFSAAEGTRRTSAAQRREPASFATEVTEPEGSPAEITDPGAAALGPEADRDAGPEADPASDRRGGGSRALRNVHERLRGLNLAAQIKLATSGELHERIVLERLYGKNVWETLLRNPRLTAPEVSRIARYGSLPRVLLEVILANNAWLQVPEVRRALLSNPRLGTDQIVKVLRLVPKHELRLAAVQTAYPHAVRNAAKMLIGGD